MTTYFTITVSVANIFRKGDFDSPVVTQGLMGESCPILGENEKWVYIRQQDGYEGWINRSYGVSSEKIYPAVVYCDDLFGMVYTNPELTLPMQDLTYGDKLQAKKTGEIWCVTLPDGRLGWTKNKFRKNPRPPHRETLVKIGQKFLGVQYLWGGKSPKGFDCSGLVQTIFHAVGVSLPRDSQEQSKFFISHIIDRKKTLPGDLHFFGQNDQVSHVAIST